MDPDQCKKDKKKRFCNKSCSAKWRVQKFPELKERLRTPEHRERSRKIMMATRERPDVQEKLRQHLSGETNPFKGSSQGFRKLAHEKLAAKGWEMLYGGNGKGPTAAQLAIFLALGPPWKMEHAIRQQEKKTTWVIDIAHVDQKIALEVDGASHSSRSVQERDARKTAYLESLGWTVIRVTNKEALENLVGVVSRCLTLKRAQETTL